MRRRKRHTGTLVAKGDSSYPTMQPGGPYALPFVQDGWAEQRGRAAGPRVGPDYAAPLAPRYFNYRKASIYAGSTEIQRNIIAKLLLGL